MKRILEALLLTLVAVSQTWATPKCAPLNKEVSVRAVVASAGFFANLRNADYSVGYVTDALLRESEVAAARLSAVESDCRPNCPNAVVAIVFSSVPNITLREYDERARCEVLLEKTRRHPIQFLDRSFNGRDEFEDWYKDLTQGDGKDGESLYEQCPGRCSPQYSSTIVKRGEKLVVSTSVVCGHARDKDDDQYVLRSAVRWICSS